MAQNQSELTVWRKSIDLVVSVYHLTESFPDNERFGLTNQMRRAAVSIPSNIAEGHARKGDIEFSRFLKIAYGSSAELETQLVIAKEIQFILEKDSIKLSEQITEIRKMLNSLITTLKTPRANHQEPPRSQRR